MSDKKILIQTDDITLNAILFDTSTANKIFNQLPITSLGNRWGDEIYFSVNISDELKAESTDLFNVGDLAFWPPGNAFCIFWGPTPASEKDEIRAASPANLIGKIIDNPLDLSSVSSGEEIIIKVSE
ncbi:MAG: hypothetical protein FI688_05105 [SAR202 cluster bacterium]|nr:hypothetical protein [Chloroflexota bacterium]MQG22836.1 hypothetical protein [SAR202 cluster bacterium]|tara:strand:+ start:1037 stop:1417 length:381 start_codon:yes stop_codon:yes gene_type:complete